MAAVGAKRHVVQMMASSGEVERGVRCSPGERGAEQLASPSTSCSSARRRHDEEGSVMNFSIYSSVPDQISLVYDCPESQEGR